MDSEVCIENSRFVMKRHWRNDFSVQYSIYLTMNSTTFENYVPLQDLHYTGVQVPPANHTYPGPPLSWAEKHYPAFSSSLGDIASIDYTRKINYYVIYAAIDLMNYHYTKLDKNGTVVSFLISL